MPEKYKNKYRIPSARLPWWDYSSNAAYFVTICTLNREHFFGEITDNTIALSEIGEIVEKEWINNTKLRPDMNLQLGAYVVMPNHFHGIIIIGENKYNSSGRDTMHCVSTRGNRFAPRSKNLASVIRGFKIGVTKNARLINPRFAWQSRFYDHIIRNEKSYVRIVEYVLTNPLRWQQDKYY